MQNVLPGVKGLFVVLSPRRSDFKHMPVHVAYLVDTKWHCDVFSSHYFGFCPVTILPLVLLAHSVMCHRRCIISAFYNVVK
jgi:hypothetical protein